MLKASGNFGLVCLFGAVMLVGGCKPKSPPASLIPPPAHLQTPIQTESEFILDTIVSDLAEEMFYAKFHRLPDQHYFSVTSHEKPGASPDAPVYNLQVRLDPKQGGLQTELAINGPIWSPEVYRNLAVDLAGKIGLNAGKPGWSRDTSLLFSLTDGKAGTIERQNQDLSAALEEDFGNPVLHEKAALLLGAFLLRDHSGHYFEIRSPLCRMTAHLTMAAFLNGTNAFGLNGQMAEAVLLSLMGNQASAIDRLNAINTNQTAALPMINALRARNTGDYRPLSKADNLSPIESVEWFCALAGSVAPDVAWTNLSDVQQRTIDFVRLANRSAFSVEMGHQLLAVSIPLELREIAGVYQSSHHEKLSPRRLVDSLNELPDRCFTTGSDGGIRVRVIGWGQWAAFLQRHLCLAIQENYEFLQDRLGVPDEARQFATGCEQEFGWLRLYPFVQLFICRDTETYRKSMDNALKVIAASPQLVPGNCWDQTCSAAEFAPSLYVPNNSFQLSQQWYNFSPLPGTVYDLNGRLRQPSLIMRTNIVACLERLHKLAPYHAGVTGLILIWKYHNQPTYDQAMALYGPLLPYSARALKTIAGTVSDQPDRYEKVMLQAAELDPARYYSLGEYFGSHTNEDRQAFYYDKACETDPDSIRVSNYAVWRVRYYLKKGKIDKARQIADFAADVYSSCGLQSEAIFQESTSNYVEAFEWYVRIEDRYDDVGPLIAFCERYRAKTGDQRFEPEVQKRLGKLFTNGIENVTLDDFHGRPTDGVLIEEENSLLKSAGLQQGDVIVAVYGMRVHNFQQYTYGREQKSTPELDLIVWKGRRYLEFKPNVPGHQFGVQFGDYKAPWFP
jgi:hypothetical protein